MSKLISRRSFLRTGACAAAAGVVSAGLAAQAKQAAKPVRVVLIGLDGIRTDGLQQAETPNLDRLFAEGAFSWTTRDVMPSVTLPNWTSIFLGSGPERHWVVENVWAPKKHKIAPVTVDADGYYPSLFQVLKEQVPGVKTAYYWNWHTLINPINKKHLDEYNYERNDGFLDNYARAFDFLKLHRSEPTLVFLYDVHTDHAGHKHAWMSPEYLAAIKETDAAVGELVAKMKSEGIFDGTHFMFLTDHGGKGKNHGGVSNEEMVVPWGIVGPGIKRGCRLECINDTMNTAPTVAALFGVRRFPACWQGRVVEEVFD